MIGIFTKYIYRNPIWILTLFSCISITGAQITGTKPACAITDGSVANSEPCACGNTECTAGELHCFISYNTCSSSQELTFSQVNSGNCGTFAVRDKASCEAVATSMGLSDVAADDFGPVSGNPPGCYRRYNSKFLIFNPNLDSTATCNLAGLAYSCICINAPTCPNTDGSTTNASPCLCGNTICTSGNYCYGEGSLCSTNSITNICSIKDGSVENSGPCQCGKVGCTASTGLICYSTNGGGSCRKQDVGLFGYPIVTGWCQGLSGQSSIPDKASCEAAATSNGYSDVTAKVVSASSAPPGCFLKTDGQLYFNTLSTSTRQCSTYPNKQCVCISAPECVHTDGVTSNDALCGCGGVVCAEQTGMVCSKSPDTCSFPSCENIDATGENPAVCECGSATCSPSTTGRYCYKLENICRDIPMDEYLLLPVNGANRCTNTSGILENPAECACGNSLCDIASGLFCLESSYIDGTCVKSTLCTITDGTNEANCMCGSNECTSNVDGTGTGLICNAGTCSRPADCTEGENAASCSCGTVDCTSNTGLFCSLSENKCRKKPCDVTNGSSTNDGACECSTVSTKFQNLVSSYPIETVTVDNTCTVESGLYCFADENRCAHDGYGYSVVTTGKCTDQTGRTNVYNEDSCRAAASLTYLSERLNGYKNTLLSSNIWHQDQPYSYPSGCSTFYYYQNLVLNTNPSSTESCSVEAKCICLVAEQCEDTTGLVQNAKPCICGNKGCTSESGLYCDTSAGTCSKHPKCLVTDGKNANSAACNCAGSMCTDETGLYCDISNPVQKCATTQMCSNDQGFTPNDPGCRCGLEQNICTLGQYCNAEVNQCATTPSCRNANGQEHNTEDCYCATDVCTTSTGRWCNKAAADGSRCKSFGGTWEPSKNEYTCLNTFGTAFNRAGCVCGTTQCTVQSGLFCNAALNQCSQDGKFTVGGQTQSACQYTDGQQENHNNCVCGSTLCQSGNMYCDAANNVCNPSPSCTITDGSDANMRSCMCSSDSCEETEVLQKNSGTCASNEGIHCYEECKIVARVLGLEMEQNTPSSTQPSGCYIVNNQVWFNSNSASGTSCSSTNTCLCRKQGLVCSEGTCLRPPTCTHTDGVTANDGPCACGLVDCSLNMGFVCDFQNNQCVLEDCADVDGKQANARPCQCGLSVCNEDTGLHCLKSESMCAPRYEFQGPWGFLGSDCLKSDGLSKEPFKCQCGTVVCQSREFCAGNICYASPKCASTNGLVASKDTCMCNGQQCDKNYCNEAETWRCVDLPACQQTDGDESNTNDCQCSSSPCDATSGLFCSDSVCSKGPKCGTARCEYGQGCVDGACKTLPECAHDNGEDKNVECRCGSNVCSSNEYCVAERNQCTLNNPCLNITGNTTNHEWCQCGTSLCVADDYCTQSNNFCSPHPQCTNMETPIYRSCTEWRQTGECDPDGPRESHKDEPCSVQIQSGASGYCECESLRTMKYDCEHGAFTCDDECAKDDIQVNKMPVPCECGTDTCAAEEYCRPELNRCSQYEDTFVIQTTGTCPTKLTDDATCRRAWHELRGQIEIPWNIQCLNSATCSEDYPCICWLGDTDQFFDTCADGVNDKACTCESPGSNCKRTSTKTVEEYPVQTATCTSDDDCLSVTGQCLYTGNYCLTRGCAGCTWIPEILKSYCGTKKTSCVSNSECGRLSSWTDGTEFRLVGTCEFAEDICYMYPDGDTCNPGQLCSHPTTATTYDCKNVITTQCSNNNGTVLNDVATCKCGATTCDIITGMYCVDIGDTSKCTWTPPCENRDGTVRNTQQCTCGTDTCESEFCLADKNVCTPNPVCERTTGFFANTGTCRCGETTCDAASGLFCSTDDDACSKTPQCQSQDGTARNGADCFCGLTECTSETGRYCLSEASACSEYAACDNANGLATNMAECACGQTDCPKEPSYCWANRSKCSLYPDCPSTNDSVGAPCTCNTADCMTEDYCWFDRDHCSEYPDCQNTNGENTNNVNCTCNTADCSVDDYCWFDRKHCSQFPACNPLGTVANPEACTCGVAACKPGQYCNDGNCQDIPVCLSGLNAQDCTCQNTNCTFETGLECSDGACQAGACVDINGVQSNDARCLCKLERDEFVAYPASSEAGETGKCPLDDYISNKEMCATVTNKTVTEIDSAIVPRGCFEKSGEAYFNVKMSTIECQNRIGQDSETCHCFVPRAACEPYAFCSDKQCNDYGDCPNIKGLNKNENTCMCAGQECSDYCLEVLGQCRATANNFTKAGLSVPVCQSTNEPCLCGSATKICKPTLPGLSCDNETSVCSRPNECTNTEGWTENSEGCRCGAVDCSVESGFWCRKSMNQCTPDGQFATNTTLYIGDGACKSSAWLENPPRPFTIQTLSSGCDTLEAPCPGDGCTPQSSTNQNERWLDSAPPLIHGLVGYNEYYLYENTYDSLVKFGYYTAISPLSCLNERCGDITSEMKTFLDDKMKHQCMNRCKKTFPERDFFTLVSVARDYYLDPTDIDSGRKYDSDQFTELRCMCVGSDNQCESSSGSGSSYSINYEEFPPLSYSNNYYHDNFNAVEECRDRCNVQSPDTTAWFIRKKDKRCACVGLDNDCSEGEDPLLYERYQTNVKMPVCADGMNNELCICGSANTICQPTDPGLVCDYINSMCSRPANCTDTTGTEEHAQSCACGSTDCSILSGMYCHSDQDQCLKTGRCQITNGTIESSLDCRCGQTFCREADELHCLAGLSQCRAKSDFDLKNSMEDVETTNTQLDKRGKQCVFNMESMVDCASAVQKLGETWDADFQSQGRESRVERRFEINDHNYPPGCSLQVITCAGESELGDYDACYAGDIPSEMKTLYFNHYGLGLYETNIVQNKLSMGGHAVWPNRPYGCKGEMLGCLPIGDYYFITYPDRALGTRWSNGICYTPTTYPACPKQDGIHLNEMDKCLCNKNLCKWSTNKMACLEGSCQRPPVCANKNGTVLNNETEVCSCGSTHCMDTSLWPTGLVPPKLWDGEYCRISSVGPYHLVDRCDPYPVCEELHGQNATSYKCMCAKTACEPGEYCALGQCISYGGNVIDGTWAGGSFVATGFVGPLCIHTNGEVECICGSHYNVCAYSALTAPYTWGNEITGTGVKCTFATSVCSRPSTCENINGTTLNSLTCSCGAVDCWSNTGMYCYEEENMCSDTSVCANKDGTAVNSECVCRLETCGPNKYCSVSRVQPIEGSTSLGCYNFVPATTDAVYFSSMGKRFSIETCQQETAAYGYKYFGLKSAGCFGWNDLREVRGATTCSALGASNAHHVYRSDSLHYYYSELYCYADESLLPTVIAGVHTIQSCFDAQQGFKYFGLVQTASGLRCRAGDELEPILKSGRVECSETNMHVYISRNCQNCTTQMCRDYSKCELDKELTTSCLCGDDTCSTGQYCNNGICQDSPKCEFTDGILLNSASCMCGINECSSDEYCHRDIFDICSSAPKCKHTSGSTVNSENCWCDVTSPGLLPYVKHLENFTFCNDQPYCQSTQPGHERCDIRADTYPITTDNITFDYVNKCQDSFTKNTEKCLCYGLTGCIGGEYCIDNQYCNKDIKCRFNDGIQVHKPEVLCMCSIGNQCSNSGGEACFDNGRCDNPKCASGGSGSSFTSAGCKCFGGTNLLDTCSSTEYCYNPPGVLAPIAGCINAPITRCFENIGHNPNMNLCLCGVNNALRIFCTNGQYCNDEMHQCSNDPNPTCINNLGKSTNGDTTCLCVDENDNYDICQPYELCDIKALTVSEAAPQKCHKQYCKDYVHGETQLCNVFDTVDELRKVDGLIVTVKSVVTYGNGLVSPFQECTTTDNGICKVESFKECCKECPSNKTHILGTGMCQSDCDYTICKDGWLKPPTIGSRISYSTSKWDETQIQLRLNLKWTGYCSKASCDVYDRKTCCVEAQKCPIGQELTLCNQYFHTRDYKNSTTCNSFECTQQECCEVRKCTCQHGIPKQAFSGACTGDGNEECESCLSDHWKTPNDTCSPIIECETTQYETVPPTPFTRNRECGDLTVCQGDQYIVTNATIRAAVPDSQYVIFHQSVAVSDRVCKNRTMCNYETEYQTFPPNLYQDRHCSKLTPCSTEQYAIRQQVGQVWTSDSNCQQKSVCQPHQYIVSNGTTVSNRTCSTIVPPCLPPKVETQAPINGTRNRFCQSPRDCESYEYETQAPTNTRNRECALITNCSETQFQSQAPNATSDRVCTKITDCLEKQYISSANTETTDRQCSNITVCDPNENQYETQEPNETSDRICGNCTDCVGCMQETDCTFDMSAKISYLTVSGYTGGRTCSGHTCVHYKVGGTNEAVIFEPDKGRLEYGNYYRFTLAKNGITFTVEGVKLFKGRTESGTVASITKDEYLYFQIPTDHPETTQITYKPGQASMTAFLLKRDCQQKETYVGSGSSSKPVCTSVCGAPGAVLLKRITTHTAIGGGTQCLPKWTSTPCVCVETCPYGHADNINTFMIAPTAYKGACFYENCKCPVNCKYNVNTEFEPCNAACGEKGSKIKKINITVAAAHKGFPCPAYGAKESCIGNYETGKCDCDGNVMDRCGICGGRNNCVGCDDLAVLPDGSAILPDETEESGYRKVPGYRKKVTDRCGVCDGDGSTCAAKFTLMAENKKATSQTLKIALPLIIAAVVMSIFITLFACLYCNCKKQDNLTEYEAVSLEEKENDVENVQKMFNLKF